MLEQRQSWSEKQIINLYKGDYITRLVTTQQRKVNGSRTKKWTKRVTTDSEHLSAVSSAA